MQVADIMETIIIRTVMEQSYILITSASDSPIKIAFKTLSTINDAGSS